MFRRGKIVWSPVEEEYLRKHRGDTSINQLSLALAKTRNAIKRKLDEFDGKPPPKKMAKRSRIGKRKDLITKDFNGYFRSNWEANVARWFKYQKKIWRYEPEVFVFDKIKSGTVSYCPDFRTSDGWVEVKGYLDPKGKTAIRRFKQYYPDEFKKLHAIVGSPNTDADKFFKKIGVPVLAYMRDLNKQFKDVIPNWE